MNTWRSEAGCLEQPAELFTVPDLDVVTDDDRIVIRKKLLAGKEFCDVCPVVGPCWADASPIDRSTTLRGGRLPSGFTEGPKALPSKLTRRASLKSSNPEIERQILELRDVTFEDFCDYGDPVSESSIAESDLAEYRKSRSGVDALGRCRACKDRIAKRVSKQARRSAAKAARVTGLSEL